MGTVIDNYIKFVKAHEKYFIVAVIGFLLYIAIGKVEAMWSKHEDMVVTIDKAAQQQTTAVANATAHTNAQLAADYKDLAEKMAAQNAQLAATITARDAATQKQEQQDADLAPSDLAARWVQLVQLPLDSVKLSTDGLFAVTAPAVVKTIQKLELLPELQGDMSTVQTEKTNVESELDKSIARVDGLNTQIGQMTEAAKQTDKVCQDQISALKASARKSKLRWLLGGAFAVELLRLALTHSL